jgi:broad specificity phosphatase PhoE
LPYVWEAASGGTQEREVKVAVVSHGLCIKELIAALVRLDSTGRGKGKDFGSLVNTAWTRVEVAIKVSKRCCDIEMEELNLIDLLG